MILGIECYNLNYITDLLSGDLGVKALEGVDVNSLDVGEELLSSTLLVVALAANADTNTSGDTLDTTRPERLVQERVKTDVRGTHLLVCELTDDLDSLGSTSLELDTVNTTVQVDGILTSDDLADGALGLLGGCHFFNVWKIQMVIPSCFTARSDSLKFEITGLLRGTVNITTHRAAPNGLGSRSPNAG